MASKLCIVLGANCARFLVGCSDPSPPPPSALETAIAGDIARYGPLYSVACPTPVACRTQWWDTSPLLLPVEIQRTPGGWMWHVDGLVVRVAVIETYLTQLVADLGARQRVDCGRVLRRLEPGDRIACALERGGTAFVTVHADGSFEPEVVLDPASAHARSRDREIAEPGGDPDDD